MKKILFGNTGLSVSSIALGCMRLTALNEKQAADYIAKAMDLGIDFFDHADIYGGGESEALFGRAVNLHSSIREKMILQTKCAIVPGKMYDFSKKHIIASVEDSLKRLNTEYVDVLLLHRPDALMEPEEVAAAFDELEKSGKVRYFGVSNHRPLQIELLKTAVKQPLTANQLQFSLPVSNMIASGMEANMTTPGSADRDGEILNYCRLNHMTIQAWSPYQKENWQGPFIGSPDFPELNALLNELAIKYNTGATGIATAWILRHPANMQVLAGTMNSDRLEEIAKSSDITLTREEWYRLYLAAGHILP